MSGTSVYVVNLDPAAENFAYDCAIDVRDLISVDDVMEELGLGPNGGLVYAMEYILENLTTFVDQLEEYGDDEYFLFDCPGQIELYSHLDCMRNLLDVLQGQLDVRVCGVYCIDINFLEDAPKFLSGALAALTAMVHLELPHINVITKCDLLRGDADAQAELEDFLEGDVDTIVSKLKSSMHPKYRALNEAMGEVLQEYSLVSFVSLNREDEESIDLVLQHINFAIQYGENLEPKMKGLDRAEQMQEDNYQDPDDGGMGGYPYPMDAEEVFGGADQFGGMD